MRCGGRECLPFSCRLVFNEEALSTALGDNFLCAGLLARKWRALPRDLTFCHQFLVNCLGQPTIFGEVGHQPHVAQGTWNSILCLKRDMWLVRLGQTVLCLARSILIV